VSGECSYFFFSSRRRHTRFSRDWSSDVCSSDLGAGLRAFPRPERGPAADGAAGPDPARGGLRLMPVIEIVPAAPEHVDPIASDPREADVAELWAVGRVTPEQAMVNGLRGSARAWTGMVDGVPACMFGATPYSILGGMGTPWMIGSNALGAWSAQKALLREARPVVDQMQAMFPKLLFNVVDQRNVQAQ